jgi:hypothetical protein
MLLVRRNPSLIHWPSPEIHKMDTQRRARIRPSYAMFEHQEPWTEPQLHLRWSWAFCAVILTENWTTVDVIWGNEGMLGWELLCTDVHAACDIRKGYTLCTTVHAPCTWRLLDVFNWKSVAHGEQWACMLDKEMLLLWERTIDIYGLLANLFSRVIVQNNAAAAMLLSNTRLLFRPKLFTEAMWVRVNS